MCANEIKNCPWCNSSDIHIFRDAKANVQYAYCAECKQRGPEIGLISDGREPSQKEITLIVNLWGMRLMYDSPADDGDKPLEKPKIRLNGRLVRLLATS